MAQVYYPRCRVAIQALLEDFVGGGTSEVIAFEVVPRRCSVRRNDHRTADEVRLELDYRDFPLDPRTLRSVLVAVGMADVNDPSTELDLSDTSTRVFIGYIDEPESVLDGDGDTVKMSGRDYSGLLLDHTWRDGAIDISRGLGDVLASILEAVPGAEQIAIEFSQGANEVDLSTRIGRTLWTPQPKDDAWTIIVEMCLCAGLIATIELDTLVVRTSAEFGTTRAAFVYGENLERLTFKRNFVEARSMQLRVIAWDEASRTSTEATYPTTPIVLRKRVLASGQVRQDAAPIITFTVAGTWTQGDLLDLAQSLYEEAAREQVEGELETREMVDAGGTVALPLLANGDAITVELGRSDDITTILGMSEGEAVTFLTSAPRNMDPTVAAALVASWTDAGALASTFYVKEAAHTWSRDDGYKLRVRFLNYLSGA